MERQVTHMAAQLHIMVRATPLTGVCGRVDYISNPERQEHLEATCSTAGKEFWKALAQHCQEQAKYSKSKRACEGREFMVQLANELAAMEPAELAEMISNKFKELTGTENTVALHWNAKKNNYHAHVITAENQEINEVTYGAVLTRNTYYDASGKRSTKKECTDPEGNLKEGCQFYKKGERIEYVQRFGTKLEHLSSKSFLQTVKEEMSDFQNDLLQNERFKVFDQRDIYLAQQHVGKNKTLEQKAAIEAKNALINDYNAAVNDLLHQATKMGQKVKEGEINNIRNFRNDIKKHRLTEKWMRVVKFYLKKLRERTAMLQKLLSDVIQEQKVKERLETKTLNKRMDGAHVRAQESTPRRTQHIEKLPDKGRR